MAVTTRLWSARRLLLTMSSQSTSTFANQVVAFVILWLIVVTQALGVLFDRPGMVARDALVPRVARQDDVPWSGRPPSRRPSRTPPCSSARWPPGC